MALVNFKKGKLATLPQEISEGTLYVVTDERAIYLDVDSKTRIRIGDLQEVDNLDALKSTYSENPSALYYVKDINCLAKYDSEKKQFIQINTDTGATKVEVVGEGNAVTKAEYNATTRTLTLTKEKTFLEGADLSDINDSIEALEEKVGEDTVANQIKDAVDELEESLQDEIDKKVESVTAADNSITVTGESTDPKIAVNIDTAEGNALKLNESGLRVDIPTADTYGLTKDDEPGTYAAVYHLTKNTSFRGGSWILSAPSSL